MNVYSLRKNFIATFSEQGKTIRGKIAFKTKQNDWLEAKSPVIVLVSVDSLMHEGVGGDLKMNALISTLRNHIKGKITILLADRAHIATQSLKYGHCIKKALNVCIANAKNLHQRYQHYFEGCDVVYWHSYIYEDNNFAGYLKKIKDLYLSDPIFQNHVEEDLKIAQKYRMTNDALYKKKAIEDLLEQCACLSVLSEKGYRFQFYPGMSNESVDYVNRVVLSHEKQVAWINVFLAIEKKTVIFTDDCLV